MTDQTARALGRQDRSRRAAAAIQRLRGVGWTLTRIARELEMDVSTLARWRAGQVAPGHHAVHRLERLAQAQPEPESPMRDPAEIAANQGTDDARAQLEAKWRRAFNHLREQRDQLLMLVLEFDQRLAVMEAKLAIRVTPAPALDSIHLDRIAEALDTSVPS